MTEIDVLRMAIRYAQDRGFMLDSPTECTTKGFEGYRTMCYWATSKLHPGRLVKSSFSYDVKRLDEAGYENLVRANCKAAIMSLDNIETDALAVVS